MSHPPQNTTHDLFGGLPSSGALPQEPLASRMRPRNFGEFFGQLAVVRQDGILRRSLAAGRLCSVIFYGPPGTGKTSLARMIAAESGSDFLSLNAVSSGVSDLRKALEETQKNARRTGRKTLLFIDEIHRFNRSQQDVLMPDIERGNPVLVGATTHNPFFSIIAPLLSRSIVLELKALDEQAILQILEHALADCERGLGGYPVVLEKNAGGFLAKVSDGDARRALSALEIGVLTTPPAKDGKIHYTVAVAEESIQKKIVRYDGAEDEHYDHASALIKSMRGSDPDAAVYYLAKMLYAGEDPRFIARRIVICAAEDIGNADPMALVVAQAAFEVAEFVGMPEARIPLAQAVTYLACAPKSNAAYLAIEKATADITEGRSFEVPEALKDSHYRGAKKLGRGEGYQYAHDFPHHYAPGQKFLSEKRDYYIPTDEGYEKKIRERLEFLKSLEAIPPPKTPKS